MLDIPAGPVRIQRIHIEEEAGKSIHLNDETLIDLNRAGIPLLEVVTEPMIESGEQASDFVRRLRRLVRYLGISDGDMERGNIRCDVNISTGDSGRTEIKNLNSLRHIRQAIRFELKRQADLLEKGCEIPYETRHFDETSKATFAMRSKENLTDYRFFPEPDLPELILLQADVDRIHEILPELPWQKLERYLDAGVRHENAEIILEEPDCADYFDDLLSHLSDSDLAANLFINDIKHLAEWHNIMPAEVGRLVDMETQRHIDRTGLQMVLEVLSHGITGVGIENVCEGSAGFRVEDIVRQLGLALDCSRESVELVAMQVLVSRTADVERYRAGKHGLLGMFVGETLKSIKADPRLVREVLEEKLNGKRDT